MDSSALFFFSPKKWVVLIACLLFTKHVILLEVGGNKNSSTKNIYYGLVTCPSLGTLLPGTSSYKHTCLLVSGYLPKKERKKNDEII